MNSKEILEMNQRVRPEDEGVADQENRARKFSMTFMALFLLALILYAAFKGLRLDVVFAVYFINIASVNLYRFGLSKQKGALALGIASAVCAIAFLARFVLFTW